MLENEDKLELPAMSLLFIGSENSGNGAVDVAMFTTSVLLLLRVLQKQRMSRNDIFMAFREVKNKSSKFAA